MKYISAKELREGGYLQEVNRRFFHPLGLALAVVVGEGADPGQMLIGAVQDFRDDLEGVYFGDVESGKVAAIDAEWERRRASRESALGFMTEPVSQSPVTE